MRTYRWMQVYYPFRGIVNAPEKPTGLETYTEKPISKDTEKLIWKHTEKPIWKHTEKPIWKHTKKSIWIQIAKAISFCRLDNTSCNKCIGTFIIAIKSCYALQYYDERITEKIRKSFTCFTSICRDNNTSQYDTNMYSTKYHQHVHQEPEYSHMSEA
jgi:hypothetical protein